MNTRIYVHEGPCRLALKLVDGCLQACRIEYEVPFSTSGVSMMTACDEMYSLNTSFWVNA